MANKYVNCNKHMFGNHHHHVNIQELIRSEF